MVVARRQRSAFRPERGQGGLNPSAVRSVRPGRAGATPPGRFPLGPCSLSCGFAGSISDEGRAHEQGHDPAGSIGEEPGMLGRGSLGFRGPDPRGQVIGQRGGPHGRGRLRPWDQAVPSVEEPTRFSMSRAIRSVTCLSVAPIFLRGRPFSSRQVMTYFREPAGLNTLAIGFVSCLLQGSNQGGGLVASGLVPRSTLIMPRDLDSVNGWSGRIRGGHVALASGSITSTVFLPMTWSGNGP